MSLVFCADFDDPVRGLVFAPDPACRRGVGVIRKGFRRSRSMVREVSFLAVISGCDRAEHQNDGQEQQPARAPQHSESTIAGQRIPDDYMALTSFQNPRPLVCDILKKHMSKLRVAVVGAGQFGLNHMRVAAQSDLAQPCGGGRHRRGPRRRGGGSFRLPRSSDCPNFRAK